jgi:hypothetical protein
LCGLPAIREPKAVGAFTPAMLRTQKRSGAFIEWLGFGIDLGFLAAG